MAKRYHDETNDRNTAVVKRLLGPLFIFSVVINLLTLVLPIYMLQIYDRVLTSRNLTTLLLLTIVAFAFLAVGSILTHYRSRMAARLGTQLTQKMEQPSFNLLLKDRLDGKPVQSQLIQQLDFIREFVGGGNMVRLFDIPWTPLFLLVIYLLHPLAGAVATGFALAMLLIDWLGSRDRHGRSERYTKARAKADQFLSASLARPEEIWAMGMADGVGTDWQRRRARALAEQTETSDIRSRHDAISRFLQQGAQMAMLGTGAFLAVQGYVTAGTIVAGSIICARALSPLRGATRSVRDYRDVRKMLASFRDIAPDREVHTKHQTFMPDAVQLQVHNLAVDLGQGMDAVIRNLEFALSPGQSMSIVGPGGTGKSMLAKTLIGARRPGEGTVRINGIDLHSLSADRLGRMVGYMPRQLSLLDGTLGQVIARFGRASLADLDQAVQRAGLAQCVDLLPEAYDTPITVAAQQLSQAHLRLVALARALYGDPNLLVLDQIDESMDPTSLQILDNVIQYSRAAGQIVMLVTNRTSIVQRLDHVLILSKRGVETCCPVNQLAAMSGTKTMTKVN